MVMNCRLLCLCEYLLVIVSKGDSKTIGFAANDLLPYERFRYVGSSLLLTYQLKEYA